MTLQLFDLALADIDVRPSPYCWLAKFALLHKGLKFETIPLRFTEKQNYPDQDHGKLPILKDDDLIVCDSFNIIAHLDKHYSNEPLTASKGERAAVDFYISWMGANLFPALGPMMYARVHAAAHADDKEYFRASREVRFSKTLEELSMTPGVREKMEAALQTLAAPLTRYKYLGGDRPNLSDYSVFGAFMWQRTVTSETLYEAPQAVDAWTERMLDLFDGYGRKAKRAA
jgi:glutathione S-transferase